MNILYIEPYYSGSHKRWIDCYRKYSDHHIDILSLPGNKWKWRMHGGAITLADQFIESNKTYDLILCSDFLNLPVFKSLVKHKTKNTSFVMYFHENQLSYPWSPDDDDLKLNRDLHYHYINYTSSLVADFNLFNSEYHKQSYITALKRYLKKMPDHNNFESIDVINAKSDVLYIGCELNRFDKYKCTKKSSNKPLILWNHRWEYDKNPDYFFNVLFKLKNDNIDFELAVLGQSFKTYPDIFDKAKDILSDNLIHFGYCDDFDDYAKWLWRSDVLPVTSNQDFFGISVVEAAYCNTTPILPNRLTYPELFDIKNNSNLFYNDEKEFYIKLKNLLTSKEKYHYNLNFNCFDWLSMSKIYDKRFAEFY